MLEIVWRRLSFKAKVSAPFNRVTQFNSFFLRDDSFPLNTDMTPRFDSPALLFGCARLPVKCG